MNTELLQRILSGARDAALLLADPTFALMSPAERRLEASELRKTAGLDDDPLEAALAVSEAENRAEQGEGPEPPPAPILPAGVEPCREFREQCVSPVSATGRCMDCGAQRRAAEPLSEIALREMLAAGEEIVRETFAAAQHFRPVFAPVDDVPSRAATVAGQYREPEPGYLARFKATTGSNDRQIADLLGLARSSVQAIIGGRAGERLRPAALEALAEALDLQMDALIQLRTEIINPV